MVDERADQDGDDVTPWMWLRHARKQLGDGHLGIAVGMLEGLLDEHPDFTDARGWFGVALARQGRERKALAALAAAADSAGAPNEVLQAYALCLARLGRSRVLRRFVADRWEQLDPPWLWPGGPRPLDRAFAAARTAISPTTEQPCDLGVFVHLPFCAGTSFASSLHQQYGDTMASLSRRGGRAELASLLEEDDRVPVSTRLLRIHHPTPVDTSGRDAVWFTVLREPVARFVSGFRKRLEPKILPALDFRFAPSLEATIENAESRRLHDTMARNLAIMHPDLGDAWRRCTEQAPVRPVTFEEQLVYLDVTADLSPERLHQLAHEVLEHRFRLVGVVEHFDASYLLAGAAVGMKAIRAPIHRGRSRRDKSAPTADQLARIGDLHTVDLALWEAWRRRFEDRFAEVLAALGDRGGGINGDMRPASSASFEPSSRSGTPAW